MHLHNVIKQTNSVTQGALLRGQACPGFAGKAQAKMCYLVYV